jgi:hypothetical protein
VQNGILVAGGCRDRSAYSVESSCEYFDCGLSKWITPVASLNTRRSYTSAATHADTVYVFGGEGSNNRYLDDVEQYDYAANKWTVLQARLSVARGYLVAVCVSGRIIIAGGYNGEDQSTVECFDPIEKRISNVSALSEPRNGSAIANVHVPAGVLKRLFESPNATS